MPGLTETEAQARLRAEGYNELPHADQRTLLRIVTDVLREPMFALLLCGGAIYLLLGDLKEAVILAVFAVLSLLITVIQEARTERVLDALRDLTSPRALVVRGGERHRIAGRDVVRGDLVILAEGDRVPADAVLLQAHDLQADESLLTGESVPVGKTVTATPRTDGARPGGDGLPFVYSGSLIVRGNGEAEVIATGQRSEIGKIGLALHGLVTAPPRLQAETRRLVRLCAIGGAGVSVVAVLLHGLLRGAWLEGVLAGIAIGMSMLPEEFPVVLTIFMAMGAWRISAARVLTRRAAAIETLGSATVLCTDKTGTLTENKMSVAELRLLDGAAFRAGAEANLQAMPPVFRDIARHARLASAPQPFDPMERALHSFSQAALEGSPGVSPVAPLKLTRSYGLRPDLLAMTQVWHDERGGYVAATKGAPEAIATLCRFDEVSRARLLELVECMADNGLRVLGIAQATYPSDSWPDSQRNLKFRFLGLVGLADPLRPGVPDAIRQCREAGIRVIMVTGDYPATARAIAQQAGLTADQVLTGGDIERLDDAALANRVRTTNVFARILPEQKLRIVQTLKADGEIVAMTGDGVNDAPSLKAADIGVAMGGRGTDVAREASAIVLLDDEFGSIVTAIRLGRRIYDNLRKAMNFIFAVHVPIAGLAILPLALGLPIILGPVHIALLEMIIDPVCSLAFEAESEEADVMRRKPRATDEPLFSWSLVAWSGLQGGLSLVLVGGIYLVATMRGIPAAEVRALTFFALVMTIVSLILINRSFSTSLISALWRPNPALVWILLAVATILGLSLTWPGLANLFQFGPLHPDDLALTVVSGIVILAVLELLKPAWRKQLRQ